MNNEDKEIKNFLNEYRLENAQPSSAFQEKLEKKIMKSYRTTNKPNKFINIFRSKAFIALASFVFVALIITSGIVFASSNLFEQKLSDQEIINKVYANGVANFAAAEGESEELQVNSIVSNVVRGFPSFDTSKYNYFSMQMEYVEYNDIDPCYRIEGEEDYDFLESFGRKADYKIYSLNENNYLRLVSFNESIEEPIFYMLATPTETISYSKDLGQAWKVETTEEENLALGSDEQMPDPVIEYIGTEDKDGESYYKFELIEESNCPASSEQVEYKLFTYADKESYQIEYMEQFIIRNGQEQLAYSMRTDYISENVEFGQVSQYFKYDLPYEIQEIGGYLPIGINYEFYEIFQEYVDSTSGIPSEQGFVSYIQTNYPEYVGNNELLEVYKEFANYLLENPIPTCAELLQELGSELTQEQINAICNNEELEFPEYPEFNDQSFIEVDNRMAELYGENWYIGMYDYIQTYAAANQITQNSGIDFLNAYYPELNNYPQVKETMIAIFQETLNYYSN